MNWLKHIFKHWFVPNPSNDHQPHFLRSAATLSIIIAILFMECAFLLRQPGLNGSSFLGDIINSVLVQETNQNRTQASLGTLTISPVLQAAAAAKAADMASKSYFAHTSPEGLTPWYWFQQVGYSYTYAGENLAVDFTDSKDVTQAWMNSPGHRANILNGHFTEIGIASAQGMFEGHPTTFVVQLFGTPAPVAPVAVVSQPTSTLIAASTSLPAVLSASSTASVTPISTPKPVVVQKPKPAVPAPTKLIKEEPNFIAVENPLYATSSFASATVASVGTSGTTAVTGSIATATANPNRTLRSFALLIALLVLLALGIKIFHVGFAYPRLIMNGLVVLILLAGIIVLNQFHFADATQIL